MKNEKNKGKNLSDNISTVLRGELDALDKDMVFIDGNLMKPSQCYHLESDPPHVLFNTNCPDSLREKINEILLKHFPANNDRS